MADEKEKQQLEEEDKWAIVIKETDGKKWKDKSCNDQLKSVVIVLFKLSILLGLLYIFVCSLGMLGDAFKLLGGKKAGEAFRSNKILSNPIADLMMGVMVTVLLQSSSTTTSIVVAMVASDVLPVGPAIYVVMGANIGTSVTNTIVAMGHVYNRDEFRRAFAGATVHDMFNWLSVVILLPVEWISSSVGSWGKDGCGLLCQVSEAIVKSAQGGVASNPELLKKITKPLLKKIVQLDKKVLTKIAQNPDLDISNISMIKAYHCSEDVPYAESVNGSCMLMYKKKDIACGFLFESVALDWKDWEVGLCILFFSLVLLTVSLVIIVKLLSSMLRGPAARIVQKMINSKIPKPFSWLTGYLVILIGTGLTMLLQSSSIFTSAMTPLVGTGILHIKRMYPLTLGANIGTTFTAILASLAIGSEGFEKSMQVALCHFFFNIFGIIIWYPIPAMRNVPIALAKGLGNTTANHRWFPLFYILTVFLCLPAAVFALSLAGWKVALGVLLPLFILFIIIIIINVLQRKCPKKMTPRLRTWEFLPAGLRSLSFYDRVFGRICCKCKYCVNPSSDSTENDDMHGNDIITVQTVPSDDQPLSAADNKAFEDSLENISVNTGSNGTNL